MNAKDKIKVVSVDFRKKRRLQPNTWQGPIFTFGAIPVDIRYKLSYNRHSGSSYIRS